MVIMESIFGEKSDCQTGKWGRKKASLVTLVAELAIVPTRGAYHSHGGNVVKVPY